MVWRYFPQIFGRKIMTKQEVAKLSILIEEAQSRIIEEPTVVNSMYDDEMRDAYVALDKANEALKTVLLMKFIAA
tara:strand:+ start:112 stop:336 length:225 start_codon:yes stop_codon:yes gene_type:complete